LPIVIVGTVVGRRPPSERFPTGVYLQLPEEETEKCRRFLGLAQSSDYLSRARKTRRTRCELKVSITSPALPEACLSHNVSATGLLLACGAAANFVAGQRVSLGIDLSEGTQLTPQAEITWLNVPEKLIGLRFVELSHEDAQKLETFLGRLFKSEQLSRAASPRTVVVADDEPDILKLLTTVLMKHGYRTYQALNGADALTLIRELMPRLVVIDILMPQMDGQDICKIMRADAEMLDIPVIFVSALDPSQLHRVADDAGATDYLVKPVNLAELINLVGRYLK
jgi:CheY-like chemotaxis protein